MKKIKRTLYFPLFMQQQVAPRLDRIVTVSEASRAEIERYFGIPEKEIAVVYNGTDSELFHPVDVAKEADLLFVGRTEDRKKGIGTLLEAMSLLPEHVTLKIVDGRIPDDGLVMRYLRRIGIERPRDAAPAHAHERRSSCASTRPARVAVVPSFFEGFGFPASEAMACGLPGDRERRGRAARGGRHRRQRGPAGAAARSARRWPRRSATCSPSRERAEAMGRAARARVRATVPAGSDAAARARRACSRRRCVLLTVDLERLGVRRGERLLDAGCGEGRHCFGAIERGARVVGLDLDRASLHEGRRRAALPRRGAAAGSARCSRATPSTCRSPTRPSTR